MLYDVVAASHLGDYRIEITFENGKKGIVDFSKYARRGGVFRRFRDPEFFRGFEVNAELGVLVWGGEIDIAPETLYAEATGSSQSTRASKGASRKSRRRARRSLAH